VSQANAPARELEEMADQRDALALMLAKMENANRETVPAAVVARLAAGEVPLRVWREHRGLDVPTLAQLADVDAAAIVEIEAGRAEGRLSELDALAKALAVDLDDLIAWRQD
jgi:DNA-binding Xre family transcriptional regulator